MNHAQSANGNLTPFLIDLLERWSAGAVTPAEMMSTALERWESGAWPELADDDPADAPIVVLDLLAHARSNSLVADDIPALLAILRSPVGHAYERLGEYFATIAHEDARDRLMRSGYYGLGSERDAPSWEIGLRDPEKRRLHRGVREDPESVWDDVRARVCRHPDDFSADLLEDLLFNHADAFADRIIALADVCPEAKFLILSVDTGGRAETEAIRRFEVAQHRLEEELVAAGDLVVWRSEDGSGPRDSGDISAH